MKFYLSIFCLLAVGFGWGQTCKTQDLCIINPAVDEASGLLHLEDRWITFNDSGGEPKLYEIDIQTGEISRTVWLNNASNRDWEAITKDDEFIYIGDIGNNKGVRKDLVIYKIRIKAYLEKDTVDATQISISYENQKNYDFEPFQTEWDAEALFVLDDKLMLISKNWKRNVSYFYQFSKTIGTYKLQPIDSLITVGKITDAFYDNSLDKLTLVGYGSHTFSTVLRQFSVSNYQSFASVSCELDLQNSNQVEGIFVWKDEVYFASETSDYTGVELQGVIGKITNVEQKSRVEIPSEQIQVSEYPNKFVVTMAVQNIKKIKIHHIKTKKSVKLRNNTNIVEIPKQLLDEGENRIVLQFENKQTMVIKIFQ